MKHDAEALGRLKAWMRAEGLKELSPPVYGYFDPPWTPGFLDAADGGGEMTYRLRTR